MMTQEKANSHNRFFATIGIEIQRKLGLKVEPTPTDKADDRKEDSRNRRQHWETD